MEMEMEGQWKEKKEAPTGDWDWWTGTGGLGRDWDCAALEQDAIQVLALWVFLLPLAARSFQAIAPQWPIRSRPGPMSKAVRQSRQDLTALTGWTEASA